jgi:uncharacterized SAM-binding protein YcdF (DUF218 family)
MFFTVSKLGWFLVQPMSLVVLLLAAGFALLIAGRRTSGGALAGLGLLTLLLCGYTSLGAMLIQPLEHRYARPAPPERVDGIVVLGGGVDTGVAGARRSSELNAAGDRFAEAMRLAVAYPAARILFTGTPGEAAAARRFVSDMRLAADRALIDDRSGNTEENATFSRALARPAPGETWLLVTSAWHMPRAMALFRQAGFAVVPWPVDYRSRGNGRFELSLDDPALNVSVTGIALHEWLGLIAYWLTGRIASPFPGPSAAVTVK